MLLTDRGDDGEGVQETSGEGPLGFAFQRDVTSLPAATCPHHHPLLVGAYFLSYSRKRKEKSIREKETKCTKINFLRKVVDN